MNFASKDISEDFPTGEKIYLNNGSVSMMPVESIEAMKEFLTTYNRKGPDSSEAEQFVSEKINSARKIISDIISCQPQEVAFTQSTTDGINFVANGLEFPGGSNIIIRGRTHEHHANFYPWLRLQGAVRVNSMTVDENGMFDFDDFESMLDGDTKLVALSHALYNTGTILPVERVGRMVREGVMFFVDGAQTTGCLNVDVSKINCDFMAFNGSKWLCGPMGTGLFYCNKKSSAMLEPTSVGGESAMIYDGNNLAYKDIPEKFQTGFRNLVGIVGLESSARYLLRFGIDNIRKKNMQLANIMREELSRIKGVTLYGPQNPDCRTSIISFNVGGFEPEVVVERLEKDNIVLAVREIFEKKIIRASPHFFNTAQDVLRTVDALKRL